MECAHLILRSLTIGKASPTAVKASGKTGIDKKPVGGKIHVGRLGLAGDEICDLENHGGEDQAVYVYGSADYDWWQAELGRDLQAGVFGENMVFEALSCRDVFVGDRFTVGELVLEVTSARIPCATFAERMGDKLFPKRFQKAGRPGFYCRVIKTGDVAAGMAVEHRPYEGSKVPVSDLAYGPRRSQLDAAAIETLLSTPLHWKIKDYLVGKRSSP